jgi:UDP-N-acetylglucosamine 2-epimerase
MEGITYETLPKGLFNGKFSSRICVWGQKYFDELSEEGTDPDKLAIVGPVHLDQAKKNNLARTDEFKKQFNLPKDKKLAMLVMPRLHYLNSTHEIIDSLKQYLDSHQDTYLIIKWHSHDTANQINEFIPEHERIGNFQHEDIRQLMATADLVLCTGTSAGGEALVMSKPLIEINWAGKNLNLGYAREGVADEVERPEDWQIIDKIINQGQDKTRKQAIEKYIQENFYKLDGQCVDRALKHVVDLLES